MNKAKIIPSINVVVPGRSHHPGTTEALQPLTDTQNQICAEEPESTGMQMFLLMERLFPLCRSITGEGTRKTLKILNEYLPLALHEVPSGTKVFDWVVPKEWNIKDAYVKNSSGEKIIDFRNSNLHVVSYSIPIAAKMSLAELKPHLHTSQEHPHWIPYRTSYYHEDWGFCLSFHQYQTLEEDEYEVYIDATLEPGSLTYGELLLPGSVSDEVLVTTHICHPSLANDNLSGISVVTFLARYLMNKRTRYTYRFLFIPGTIGAITWLAINKKRTSYIKHGLVAALLGDNGPFTYKKSRSGNAEIDQVVQYVLRQNCTNYNITEFAPYGYDERQFCSPGFDLPVGSLTRTPYGQYPEYHTSADNLQLVQPEALEASLNAYRQVVHVLEENKRWINLFPHGEPQLGRRGLYHDIGGENDAQELQLALLWVLNLSDGMHTLLDISQRSSIPFGIIAEAAAKLEKHKLIKEKTGK